MCRRVDRPEALVPGRVATLNFAPVHLGCYYEDRKMRPDPQHSPMRARIGTSGFSYDEWCGNFYPEGTRAKDMLRYYGQRLASVEVNNTFYRMPKASVLAGWYEQVPPDFRFVLKASRRITHQHRLKDAGDSILYLVNVARALGDKLGPILFQLPPFLRKDVGLLQSFLAALPADTRAALEFRHPSWFSDDVYAALAAHNAALTGGEVDESDKSPPLVATADWGYLRLRKAEYSPRELSEWAVRIAEQPFNEVYAFFKHETEGPMLAQRLDALLGEQRPGLAKTAASGPGLASTDERDEIGRREKLHRSG